jgi:hypothetical protein
MLLVGSIAILFAFALLVLAVAWSIVRERPTSMTMRVLRWVSLRIEWRERTEGPPPNENDVI